MEVTRDDVGFASDSLTAAGVAGDAACDWTRQMIDYLDRLRRNYEGSHFPGGGWYKKQALDWTITLLHEVRRQGLHCRE